MNEIFIKICVFVNRNKVEKECSEVFARFHALGDNVNIQVGLLVGPQTADKLDRRSAHPGDASGAYTYRSHDRYTEGDGRSNWGGSSAANGTSSYTRSSNWGDAKAYNSSWGDTWHGDGKSRWHGS